MSPLSAPLAIRRRSDDNEALDNISKTSVLIVGTGFAGLGMAIRLRQSGITDFVVLEKSTEVGGTWRDNTYPGLACDIPSYLYSFSFEPKHDWSRFFAPQKEILSYLAHCADKYAVRPHIRFGIRVMSADWDEGAGAWRVGTESETWIAPVLISGSGHALTQPIYPSIEGRERFGGRSMHSARWDHDYSFKGKRVAVFGTGASAIQIIPELAKEASRLHVFQRTPSWVLPKPDWTIPPWARRLFRRFPALQRVARWTVYGVFESYAVGYVVEPRLNAAREWHCRRFLRSSIRDGALRRKLVPTFRLGCKRILISNDYFPALQMDHVELVTDPVIAIHPDGVETADGVRCAVDAIVYATGYETAEARPPFAIRGRGGRSIEDDWAGGAEAYRGTAVTGFPNFFTIIGPNLGLGHNSMVYMMEAQYAYILDALRTMREKRLRSVEVRADAQARYNRWLQKRLARTVWNTGGCRSWYLTASGKNTTAWPGFTFEFWARMRRFDVESYELVTADPS